MQNVVVALSLLFISRYLYNIKMRTVTLENTFCGLIIEKKTFFSGSKSSLNSNYLTLFDRPKLSTPEIVCRI